MQIVNEYLKDTVNEYLKATVAKELRMKKWVTDPTTKRFTYKKIPAEQLKISIPNVFKPLSCVSKVSMDQLISKVL